MERTKRLFVMRHAESLEDVDQTTYEQVADEDVPLTDSGKVQVVNFSKSFIKELGTKKDLYMYLSPSKRVTQTAQLISSALPKEIKCFLNIDPLLQKQDWGSVTIHNRSRIEAERYRAGVLRYRFPDGESGVELLYRFNLFAQKLKWVMSKSYFSNFIIITHGFEFRVFLKVLLGWTEEHFETLAHPLQCEMKRLLWNKGSFCLLDEMRLHGGTITRLLYSDTKD